MKAISWLPCIKTTLIYTLALSMSSETITRPLIIVCLCTHRIFPLLLMDNVHLLHNVSALTDCQLPNSSDGGALFFYTEPTSISTSHKPTISSRQVVVGPLDPQTITPNSTSTNMPRKLGRARDKENEALANIVQDKRLFQILELVQQ